MLEELLKKLNIKYDMVCHEKIFTIEDALTKVPYIEGLGCKNLFLKSNKKKYYLYVLPDNLQVDLKELGESLSIGKLHFASEEDLHNILNLERGSVTPLGIINDKDNIVTIIIDENIIDKKILVHPNTNTKTISINYKDLIKFINYLDHKIIYYKKNL